MKSRAFVLMAVFLVLISGIASAVPVLNSIGSKNVNEGSTLGFNVTLANLTLLPASFNATFNASGNVSLVSFSSVFTNITPTVLRGAVLNKINESLANFTWTPTYTDSGAYTANFSAVETITYTANASIFTLVNAPVWEQINVNVANVPAGMSVGSIQLGSSTEERSNPRSDREIDTNRLVTGTFTITNTGTEPITGLNVTSVPAGGGFSSSAINISFISVVPTAINTTQSSTVTFQGRIPEDLDSVNSNLVEAPVKVATFTVTGTTVTSGTISTPADVFFRARNKLKIKDVRVTVDGNSKNVNNGDSVKKVKPGSEVTVQVEIENRFNKDDNVDLQDVEVRIENDDLDVDDDDATGDIGPKKTKTAVFKFTIDKDTDEDDYQMDIVAESEDENGARHAAKLNFDIEVVREEHEITISNIDLTPASITCEDQFEVVVNIRNTGQNDEEDIFIRFASPEVQFGSVAGPFVLDEDDAKTYRATVKLPANTTAGTKRISVETYYDGDVKSDSDVGLLRVGPCQSGSQTTTPPSTPAAQPPVVVQQPPTSTPPVVAQPPATVTRSFTESPYYIPALILANVVILGAGIFLVAKLFAGSAE